MPSLHHIKKRLRGISSINTMTAAMELVAATKMRRAQEAAIASRPFAYTALELLANLAEDLGSNSELPALFTPRPGGRTAILVISSDRGLAGSFNSAIFRSLEELAAGIPGDISYTTIGKKATEYLQRTLRPVSRSYSRSLVSFDEVDSLAGDFRAGYEAGSFNRLMAVSMNFESALKQMPIQRQLLPIDFKKIRETVDGIIPKSGRYSTLRSSIADSRPTRPVDYLIEPGAHETIEALIPVLFSMQMYHIILEAHASEHSARRAAMKNASDNASRLIGDLTLLHNRTRQAAITGQLIEITSTTVAMQR